MSSRAQRITRNIGLFEAGPGQRVLTHAKSGSVLSAKADAKHPEILEVVQFLHGWANIKPGEVVGLVDEQFGRFRLVPLRVDKVQGSRLQIARLSGPNAVPRDRAAAEILWRSADLGLCPGPWKAAELLEDDGQMIEAAMPLNQNIPRRLEVLCFRAADRAADERRDGSLAPGALIHRPHRYRAEVVVMYVDDSRCRLSLATAA